MRTLLAQLTPLNSENVDDELSKMGRFLEFSLYFFYKSCHYRSTKMPIEHMF